MHSQAQVPAPQQMESIGGTTYFYTQQAQQQPAVVRVLSVSLIENKLVWWSLCPPFVALHHVTIIKTGRSSLDNKEEITEGRKPGRASKTPLPR